LVSYLRGGKSSTFFDNFRWGFSPFCLFSKLMISGLAIVAKKQGKLAFLGAFCFPYGFLDSSRRNGSIMAFRHAVSDCSSVLMERKNYVALYRA
jgi:hypothetical protein